MKAPLVPTVTLAIVWPLLLIVGPKHWCTVPLPSPSPVISMHAPKPVPAVAPIPMAAPAPMPTPTPKPHPRPKRHPQTVRVVKPFLGRGNLLVPTQGGRRKTLPLAILLVVVLAPCAAAAVTRYGRNR